MQSLLLIKYSPLYLCKLPTTRLHLLFPPPLSPSLGSAPYNDVVPGWIYYRYCSPSHVAQRETPSRELAAATFPPARPSHSQSRALAHCPALVPLHTKHSLFPSPPSPVPSRTRNCLEGLVCLEQQRVEPPPPHSHNPCTRHGPNRC